MTVRELESRELNNIGHALSTLIQQRYIMVFSYICRADFLDLFDRNAFQALPEIYIFSKQDADHGGQPLHVRYLTDLPRQEVAVFTTAPNGRERYDYDYIREITVTGIRGSFLLAVQSYLDFYRVETIARRHKMPSAELFLFIRQARNIVYHNNGSMKSARIKSCKWRNISIDKYARILNLSDHRLIEPVDDAFDALARIHAVAGRVMLKTNQEKKGVGLRR